MTKYNNKKKWKVIKQPRPKDKNKNMIFLFIVDKYIEILSLLLLLVVYLCYVYLMLSVDSPVMVGSNKSWGCIIIKKMIILFFFAYQCPLVSFSEISSSLH